MIMFTSVKYAIAIAALATTVSSTQAVEVGVMNFTFDAPHRERLMQALVWYPTDGGGFPEVTGDNPVFKGTKARRDAYPHAGKYPVVILSHGAGGNAANLGWISARLVEAGFVVVAPNHHGSTSADSRPETNVKAWERPQDMTAMLNAMEQSSALQRVIDMGNVTAMGFSMGGYTALALGGAEVRIAKYAKYCDDNPLAEDCIWFERGNDLIPGHVDMHKVDSSMFDANYRDTRIKRIVAIDPGVANGFELSTLDDIALPTLFVNMGQGNDVPLGVRADKIAKALPRAKLEEIAGANHFTFLAECKLLGSLMIWLEGDDPVCREIGNRSRAEMHEEIADKIVAFLKLDQS
jgi:predicted dienelactone hydrolase